MAETRFDVDVMREAGYWVAVVRGVRGGATETRRLSDLDVEVRDLLSGLLDAEPDALDLSWHYDAALSGPAAERVEIWRRAQAQLDAARRAYEVAQTDVVSELDRDRVSVRDAAALTGLSFQRVQQVRKAAQARPSDVHKAAASAESAMARGKRLAADSRGSRGRATSGAASATAAASRQSRSSGGRRSAPKPKR